MRMRAEVKYEQLQQAPALRRFNRIEDAVLLSLWYNETEEKSIRERKDL